MEDRRQPRPMGSTFLSIEANKSGTDEHKNRLLEHVILHYTTAGFMFNGIPCSIPELSLILQVPQNRIMEILSNTAQNMGNILEPEQLENTIKSIVTLGSTWAMQDRGQITQQLNTMLQAQGGKYKAFISSEVNKSLKLLLDSNKNILDMYKTFFTSTNNTTNIFHNVQEKDKVEEIDYVTPEKALNLILDNTGNKELQEYQLGRAPARPSEMTDTDIDELYQEHNVGETPDCFEGRTGTEALRSPEAQEGPEAITPKGSSTKQSSAKVRLSSHEEVDERRGDNVLDDDSLPSRTSTPPKRKRKKKAK